MSALEPYGWRWILISIVLAFVAAACSSDGDSDKTSFAADEPASEPADSFAGAGEEPAVEPADAPAEEPPGEPTGDESGSLGVPTALTPADIGRDIIFRATISVEVDDVAGASREAQTIVEGLGGIVFGQETVTEPETRTVLTFKVLPADFSTALERLAGLGDLVDQHVTADDVTERVVDLESRINTAAASVERLRNLLDEADDIAVIAQLENQLLERETTLELLRGQLRTLRDQVDLATITLTIRPSPRVVPQTDVDIAAWLSEGDDDPCLGVRELSVEPDATVHLCLEIDNAGESTLTDLELDSDELRLRLDEMDVVEGDIDRLDAGDRLVVTTTETLVDGRIAGRVATRGLNISARVTATPVDDHGDRLGEVDAVTSVLLLADEEEPLPGFADAIGGGIDALAFIGSVLLIAIGVLLPFVPLVGIVAYIVIRLRRRHAHQTAGPAQPPEPPTTSA